MNLNMRGIPAVLPADATWMYELSARGADRALYIGVARHLKRRMRQHARSKPWWSEVYRVTALLYPSRQGALAAEACGIRCPIAPPAYNTDVPSLSVELSSDEDALCYVEFLADGL
jgi:hypothetical protein